MEHGGGPQQGGPSGAYRVTAFLEGERCRIEVSDSGPGFPPGGRERQPARPVAQDEAEHGRGLGLIRDLADHASFGNRAGAAGGGAVVSFDKILKWRVDAPLVSA